MKEENSRSSGRVRGKAEYTGNYVNALSYAIQRNCHTLIEMFLHEHLDHTGRLEEHRTFMHLVAEFADTKSLRLLAQNGLRRRNTNIKNSAGLTPVQVALQRQDVGEDWNTAFFAFLKNIDQDVEPKSGVSEGGEIPRLNLEEPERVQDVEEDWGESDNSETEFVDALEFQI